MSRANVMSSLWGLGALIALAAVLAALVPVDAHPALADGPFVVQVFAVSEPPGEKRAPAVHDNTVVWQDNRNGNWDIYAFDLQTQREFPISTAAGDQVQPRVFVPWVVWADNRNGNWDIYAFNLESKQEIRLTADPSDHDMPSIWGTTVIWRDRRNWVDYDRGSYDLYAYDLASNREFPAVVTTFIDETAPQIWGRRIAYRAAGLHGIKFNTIGILNVYDLDRKTRIQLRPPEPMPGYGFSLSGDRIAWVKSAELPTGSLGGPEMHVSNLVTGEDVNLGPPPLPAKPQMDGPLLVWVSLQRPQDDGVWLYDLDSRTVSHLIKDRVGEVALSRDVVVWTVSRPGLQAMHGTRILRQPDWTLPTGHFYTQANGRPPGTSSLGFGIIDDQQARFWSEFQRLGSVDTLAYPASQRFVLDGFTVQLTQGALLQWRPERNVAFLANIFELFERAGLDDALFARGIPRPIKDDASGRDLRKAREVRLGWLTDAAIKAKFLVNPNPDAIPDWDVERSIELYGLPMSKPERFGPFVTQRFQRVAFQLWLDEVPGMPAPGTVVRVLAGDLMKEFGLVPKEAAAPQRPPVDP